MKRSLRSKKAPLIIITMILILMTVSVTSIKAYTLSAARWQSRFITYKIDASFSNIGSGWINSLNTAVADWNAVNSSAFIFSQNGSSPSSIKAGSAGGNLAVTPMTPDVGGHFTQFNLIVDPGKPFYDGTQAATIPANYYDLKSIIRHELGHVFGLGHSKNSSDLMYSSFNTAQIKTIDTDASNGDKFLSMPYSYTGPAPYGAFWLGSSFRYPATTGTYNDNYSIIDYSGTWTRGYTNEAYAGDINYSYIQDAAAQFSFNGTRITYTYTKFWNRGYAYVEIDGRDVALLNQYSPNGEFQVSVTYDNLAAGDHLIRIKNAGFKDPVSSDYYVDVDHFSVNTTSYPAASYDDTSSAVRYHGYNSSTWTYGASAPSAHNGTISYSKTNNDGFSFTFTGSKVTYVFTKFWNRGIAAVTIDGVSYPNIDQYAASNQTVWQAYQVYNLSNGVHTITVSATINKNPFSTDYYIDLDRFFVQ